MIDFHSHILPDLDDGSSDVEESIKLLNMLSSQGVETVVATPHFFANDQSVDSFIEKRKASFESLLGKIPPNAPQIILGAEVKYYPGISQMENLEKLCIGSTDLLLLEMPMTQWTEYTVKELMNISCSGKVTLVLAHIERYLGLQDKVLISRLVESDILMQVNASFFTGFFTRRKACRLLKNNLVHLIGSDCHNTFSRPPLIGKATEIIKNKAGEDVLENLISFSNSLFEG